LQLVKFLQPVLQAGTRKKIWYPDEALAQIWYRLMHDV